MRDISFESGSPFNIYDPKYSSDEEESILSCSENQGEDIVIVEEGLDVKSDVVRWKT